MWLEQVVITNLFCYQGTVSFDFRRPSNAAQDKNIAIIWGRNGHGKTSFLNSMKLLVGGPYEQFRESMFRGRKPNVKEFILGYGDEWSGIVNNTARLEARNEVTASVEATWRDVKNGLVQVKREWTILRKTNSFEEDLAIKKNRRVIENMEEAKDTLATLFPTEYIDFVMYDGEQIQELADGDDAARQETMEKLLDITPVDQLRDNLNKARATWTRESKVDAEQEQLALLELGQQTRQVQLQKIRRELGEAQAARARLERERTKLHADIDKIQVSGAAETRANLIGRRDELERALKSDANIIANTFLVDAPLLFNKDLVNNALASLQRSSAISYARVRRDVLHELGTSLPAQLFEQPPHSQPPLGDALKRFYQGKLQWLFDGYKSSHAVEQMEMTLVETDRERIRQRLESIAHNDELRQQRLDKLHDYVTRRKELRLVHERLNDLSDLATGLREQVENMRTELAKKDEDIKKLSEEIGQRTAEESKLTREIEDHAKDIERQRGAVDRAKHISRRADMANRFTAFLKEFAREARNARRSGLEDKINEHCEKLLSSNALVKKIRVDENFRMTYHSDSGVVIGKKNMSAGMRQLIATALLWALKDESKLELPIIVDTPLARLDRDHQMTLLTQYFANASHQMILLPTDSEIDLEKYKHIRHHVYLEYVLKNDRGNAAVVVPQSMHRVPK